MEQANNPIEQAILNRKSTFPVAFQPGVKIEDAVIEKLLETAIWAPTHKETQPWRFKVYRNEGVKEFFDKQAEIYKAITSAEDFKEFKMKKYADKANQVSHVICVIAEHDEHESVPEQEELISAACVVENMYLLLESYGIGGYLSTGNLCYEPWMLSYVGVRSDEKLLGFFQVGVPKTDLPPYQRTRIPAKDKTEWVG